MAELYRKPKLLWRAWLFWSSFSLWRPRLVIWCGALATGAIGLGSAKLADLAQYSFTRLTKGG